MWRKYFIYIRQAFIAGLTYRSEMLLWLVLDSIPLLLLFLVWISAFSQQPLNQGYTLPLVLQYYFIGMVITAATSTHFEKHRVQEVREGKIDYVLTHPMSYLLEIFLTDIGEKLAYLMSMIPFYAVLFWLLTFVMPLSLPPVSWETGGLFVVLIFSAYLIQFLFGLTIVLFGFWFEGAQGLEHFKWILVTLFSGFLIPLTFMPELLKNIVIALPLKYLFTVPIGLIQNTMTFSFYDLAYLISFIGVLVASVLLLWRAARYKYASAGG